MMEIKLNQKQKKFISGLLINVKVKNPKIKKILIKEIDNSINVEIREITEILSPNFENAFSKNMGIAFTPIKLVDYMYRSVLNEDLSVDDLLNSTIADLSAGNGAFFVGLFLYLKRRKSFSLKKFIEKNIYAYEIIPENVEYMKIIFSVLIEYFGEDSSNVNFNFYICDTLKEWKKGKLKKHFDLIVGNPPYVKQQNIPLNQREFLLNNFKSVKSNYNLYYPFIELSMKLIGKNGRSVLLVPNYLLKIKSAADLRKIMLSKRFIERIVDFEYSKLFDNIDTYSMILQLHYNSKNISFLKQTSQCSDTISWKKLSYDNVTTNSINLVDNNEQYLLDSVKSQPNKLIISTGIATLKDKLYLVDLNFNNGNIKFEKKIDDTVFTIDKEMVVPITKGSGFSKSLITETQYIIYPYEVIDGKAYLFSEEEIKNNYPNTYRYLKYIKNDLLKRSGKYSENDWYKYGRSQALTRFDPKIVFPTNSKFPKFRYIQSPSLFYNGYAVYGIENYNNTPKLLKALELILNSSITQKFMKLTSYYISGGYLSYQKKYLEQLRIPNLSKEDINHIIAIKNDPKRINRLVLKLYSLN